MRCPSLCYFYAAMLIFGSALSYFALIMMWAVPVRPCADGRTCPAPLRCCGLGCCPNNTLPPLANRRDHESIEHTAQIYEWYHNWPILFLLGTIIGVCICGVWTLCRARHCSCMLECCVRRPHSDHDSAGSCYPPPQYSRCGSFHQAPPPYAEVTSKPDLYPLVITCGEGDNKSGGNYLMVHYFRNYVIRAPGSLSAASTTESISSSFICNATNEENCIVPPPYSRASTYSPPPPPVPAPPRSPRAPPPPRGDMSPGDAVRGTLITSPVQPMDSAFDLELELIDYELGLERGCRPRLGHSPPARSPADTPHLYEPDFERLRHLYTYSTSDACESPPQPTSPTQSRDSSLRRPSDERRYRRPDKYPKARKSSFYMPLSSTYSVKPTRVSPGSRSSRSAPVTPCGSLVPNLLALTQRVTVSRSKSSKLDEESDPLLSDDASQRPDNKF